MKKRFLLIPVLAAVMLSTSCSKDDNNVDTKEVNNQTEVKKTNSITITAKKKSSISKVALGDKNTAENKYEEVFSEGDVLSLFLPEAAEPFTTLNLSEGDAGKTTATFVGGEMPADANGKTITAKIIPSATPSGLQGCGSLSEAVSTYASLKGTFEYDNTQSTFSVNLDDEVSYFVIETNIENVDINGGNVDSRVFAFNTNQTVSSTALGLPEQELVAGGRVYVKNKYLESLTLSGPYEARIDMVRVSGVYSYTIEYDDDDTWGDIVNKYDWIYTQDYDYGPDGKIIYFVWTTEEGDDIQAELKHSSCSGDVYNLVSMNTKVADLAADGYYLNKWKQK